MRNKFLIATVLATLVGLASAQQASSSTDASASSNLNVSADKSGSSVQSSTSENASNQTSLTLPKHQEDASPKHKRRDNDQSARSASAGSALNTGFTINAVLSKPIDSRKCKAGDPVVATATQNVKSNGSVVIPKGSKLVGHVTQAQSRGAGAGDSSLGIVFDHAVLKNGNQVPMNSVVQALASGNATASSAAGDDNLNAMGGTTATGTGLAHSGGGLLGGVTSTAGAATSVVGNTAAVASATGSTVASAGSAGRSFSGTLNSSSTGVFGLNGLSLGSAAANSTQGSVISSTGKSVHLDSGTQLLLRVVK